MPRKRRKSRLDRLAVGQVWRRGSVQRMIQDIDETSVTYTKLTKTQGNGKVGQRMKVNRISMSHWLTDAIKVM